MTQSDQQIDPQLALRLNGAVASAVGGLHLDADFVDDLAVICEQVGSNPDVRVLLLAPSAPLWGGWAAMAPPPGDLFGPLAELPQPSIAVIEDDCLGGGFELALAADIRIAAPSVELGFPDLLDADGEFCRAGGLQRLVRAVGRSRASQMILLEERLSAERALEWGLLNSLDRDPRAAALALADVISQRGPLALRYAKDAIRYGAEMPLDQALHYETELTILLQDTEDRAEGVEAFATKRGPRFRGS